MELRFDAMLYSTWVTKISDAGHNKLLCGPQAPHPVLEVQGGGCLFFPLTALIHTFAIKCCVFFDVCLK